MFDPEQLSVNEAWIVFQLNDAPVMTEADGDFNVVCLMDAASCYIFGNEFVPAPLTEVPMLIAQQLIDAGRSQAKTLPKKLLVSSDLKLGQFVSLTEQAGMEMIQVPDEQLLLFISEARDEFRAHFGGGRVQ